MTGPVPQMPDREQRLDEAAAAYLEAAESGSPPPRDEWLARYPDLAPELADFLNDQERMLCWTSPLRDSSGKPTDEEAVASDPLATLHVPGGAVTDPRSRFPNYELLDEIARGGMGIVYRARQLNPSRIVALKMILAGPHASPAELYRFRMETQAAASLDHPHIMPIYEVGDRSGRPFFSMKLMEGGTLAEHLPRFAGDGRAAAGMLIKVARAVHHAHQRGILHRDLKPANVLLDAQGEPFVTDFGLCRRVEVDSGMTQSGMIVGTPSYMSPEQAAGRKGLTIATDVYSLGAILYTLLTDRPPFRGNTPLETVRGVLEDEPSRPRLLRPQVDRDLETICLKCLDKQPDRRYGSAEALADDLARWLAGEPIVARRSSLWERTWKRSRRNPAAAALVGVSSLALALLIAAGVIYQFHRVTAAEQELTRLQQLQKSSEDARGQIRQAELHMRTGDAQNAKLHANLAIEQSNDEPALVRFTREAEELLAQAQKQIDGEQAQHAAARSLRQFLSQRDKALFYGSQFASEMPADLEDALIAGEAALGEVGLSIDGAGTLEPNLLLTDDQRLQMRADAYELLLVLSDVSARSSPPQAARAARLKQRAQELRPTLPATTAQDHFLLGYEARRQGNLPAAIDALRQAIRSQPKHVWARYFLAASCLPTAPRESEGHLTALLDERPELYGAYLLRGIAHANLHEDEAAQADFAQALARAPSPERSPDFRYTTLAFRGSFRSLRQDFPSAEQDLLAAVRLKPDAHEAWLYLAQTYERGGRTDEAAKSLARALAANDLTPPVEAGILLYRAGRITSAAAAAADIDRSLQLYPYAEAWHYRASELLRHGAATNDVLERVVKCCDAALDSPVYVPETYAVGRTHYLRAHALVELGRHDEAAQALERFLAAGGKPTAEIHRLRGLMRIRQEDYPSAIHALGESLALEPGNPSTLVERGSVYLAIGAWSLALDDFQAALARENENASALAGRGLIRALQGDADGAAQDAEVAVSAGQPTQRTAWLAARTFALVYGRLRTRGQLVSVQESRDMVRYRTHAVAMLEKALALTPPDQKLTFWRDAIEHDSWLRLLSDEPKYRQMQRKYSPPTAATTIRVIGVQESPR